MALKTFADVESRLAGLGFGTGLIRTEEPHLFGGAPIVIYRYATGEVYLSVRESSTNRYPFTIPLDDSALRKYESVTGHTHFDLKMDVLWHFLDNFVALSSFSALRERIKDAATCGSPATTIAINKYILDNRSSEEEVRELLSGSKWRWKKTANDEYIQQALVGMYNDVFTDLSAYNGGLFANNKLGCPRNYVDALRSAVATQQREQRRREELERRQAEERETTLMSYGTRATEFFKFKKGKDARYSTFLGVELELEGHSKREYQSLNTIKDHAIFKRDGSLESGVEICTAPATLDVHKEAFAKFFAALDENGSDLEAQNSCGMHVHIDRSKMSTLHVANLCLLLNKEENDGAIRAIAGRQANSYCKKVAHNYGNFTSGQQGDRYSRVNLTPSKTVELRLFASTTNYKDFCKRLEFTQAVVDYTRPGETNITCKDIPKWDNFKAYVMKHRKTYPTLVKEM